MYGHFVGALLDNFHFPRQYGYMQQRTYTLFSRSLQLYSKMPMQIDDFMFSSRFIALERIYQIMFGQCKELPG